ncbi:cupin domain-containing protein [Bifidobacterium tissieri]|uniref:Cupin domain-containing protein n=1 Tax=Bifidobacterium tissieri TaxID=1630162 RepID=A0A5M9ZGH6_9BIFI|nr:cupin domain-containing protein [Bifidobacterium tissieri]KAA8826057.1 cupin domain-containing protein [Bifidobacterium tissieri]KAA8829862.1 cupin domain-containing protein [Bifidobacterium tissieri]
MTIQHDNNNDNHENNYENIPEPVHDIPPLSEYAKSVIAQLGLEPHPEGGWYVRDWQSASFAPADFASPTQHPGFSMITGNRPLASLIYFLLPTGDFSDWHQVDADELWLWHGPGSVTLELAGSGDAPDAAQVERIVLGSGLNSSGLNSSGLASATNGDPVNTGTDSTAADPVIGHAIVPAGVWQRTIPGDADALVSCVVSPGFTFDGFNLADNDC